MALKITNTSKTELLKLNFAVMGRPKTGKTHLISTIKDKVLLCNVDKGSLTLKSKSIDMIRITNFDEFIEFMKYITTSNDFVNRGYKWVAFDSVSQISELLQTHLEAKGFTGFDFWGEYKKIMLGLMTTTRDTERFNSLSIYEVVEKENKNGLLEKKFGIEGSPSSKAGHFYDFVFASKKIQKKDKPTQYLLQTINADGFDCLGGRGETDLNDYEPANIAHITKKLLGGN